MKNLVNLALLSLVTACGSAQISSSETSDAVTTGGLGDIVKFERYDRVVDGALVQIHLTRTERGGYDATLMRRQASWTNVAGTETVEELGYELTCSSVNDHLGRLSGVFCERDDLPVDGIHVRLDIVQSGEADKFTATLSKSLWDRMNATLIEESTELATGLTYNSVAVPGPRMCTTIAGVLYNPETGHCASFRNGCVMASLQETGYTFPPEDSVCRF